jgi:hypothetical protein
MMADWRCMKAEAARGQRGRCGGGAEARGLLRSGLAAFLIGVGEVQAVRGESAGDTHVPAISWQEAGARLAAERTRAETGTARLKKHGQQAAIFRRLATRYAKRATDDRAMLTIGMILLWL